MTRAKKVVDDANMDKSKMDLENIDPTKKKSKKVKEIVVAKEDKVEPKKDKVKPKPKEQKDMTDKELKKELKTKDKELEKVKNLINKINSIME
tara:strand:- start:4735 stop:5013 length:279 start_codon:yes stop_codon:yes gene_type:complete